VVRALFLLQVEKKLRIVSSIRDQNTKKQENKGIAALGIKYPLVYVQV